VAGGVLVAVVVVVVVLVKSPPKSISALSRRCSLSMPCAFSDSSAQHAEPSRFVLAVASQRSAPATMSSSLSASMM